MSHREPSHRSVFTGRTVSAGFSRSSFSSGSSFLPLSSFFARCATGAAGTSGALVALEGLEHLGIDLLRRIDQVVLGGDSASAQREKQGEGGGEICIVHAFTHRVSL